MGFTEIFLIGVGLAMDAFAVSVTKGLSMKKTIHLRAVIIAFFFGAFQMLMPIAGYVLAGTFSERITGVGHWIAFVLLGFIGIRMILEGREAKENAELSDDDSLRIGELILLSVATSIDALAVGVSFAFMEVDLIYAASEIGIITFFISLAGVYIGRFFGGRFRSRAEYAGGLILIMIGIKILVEGIIGR